MVWPSMPIYLSRPLTFKSGSPGGRHWTEENEKRGNLWSFEYVHQNNFIIQGRHEYEAVEVIWFLVVDSKKKVITYFLAISGPSVASKFLKACLPFWNILPIQTESVLSWYKSCFPATCPSFSQTPRGVLELSRGRPKYFLLNLCVKMITSFSLKLQ